MNYVNIFEGRLLGSLLFLEQSVSEKHLNTRTEEKSNVDSCSKVYFVREGACHAQFVARKADCDVEVRKWVGVGRAQCTNWQ